MTSSNRTTSASAPGPAWQSWLGIVAVVLGVLLAASHGTEWTRQAVIEHAMPADGQLPAAECPEDELIEEGLSLAECEQLVLNVRNYAVSAPDWWLGYQTGVAAIGTVLALLSIVVGAGLINYREWAPGAAIATFGGLAALDAAEFIGAVNAGPILRDLYLWDALLWLVIHVLMVIGTVAGRAGGAEPLETAR